MVSDSDVCFPTLTRYFPLLCGYWLGKLQILTNSGTVCQGIASYPQVKVSVLQDCLLFQMKIASPGFLPVLLVHYTSEFPMIPSSHLINLIECLTKLRKPVYLLSYQFITKDIKGYEWTTRRYIRQGMKGSGTQECLSLWSLWCVTFLACGRALVHQPEQSLNPVVQEF